MNEPAIQFPVVCAVCGAQTKCEHTVVDIANAFLFTALKLHAPCHDHSWTASQSDLRRIKEYVGMQQKTGRLHMR
jgi:hypothetical protein